MNASKGLRTHVKCMFHQGIVWRLVETYYLMPSEDSEAPRLESRSSADEGPDDA